MPDDTSEESSTERFPDYFMGKIERLRDELKDAPTFQPSQIPNLKSNLNEFKSPLRGSMQNHTVHGHNELWMKCITNET